MPPGGARSGRPGVSYPNRSDLAAGPRTAPPQPVRSAKSKTYGDRKRREDAQKVVPLPGQLTPLRAQSERPDEPVTAGLPVGAGAGPEALTGMPAANEALWELRALAQRFPYDDLLRVIARAEENM